MLAVPTFVSEAQEWGSLEDIGVGGRPVGALWFRSTVYAEHGVALSTYWQVGLQLIYERPLAVLISPEQVCYRN